MRYFLSIDYGGTNTKVVLIDEMGKEVAVSAFETVKIEEIKGYREIDLHRLWKNISKEIRKLVLEVGLDNTSIAAVICIGHGKGLYLLDKQGNELMNGILSTDERAIELAKAFEDKVDELWDITHQHIVSVQAPVLLAWLKINKPTIYQNVGSILSAKDYIRYKLTGKIEQEIGDASSNHWLDLRTRTYSKSVLDFFGIPEIANALPPLVEYDEIVGSLSEEVADEIGLKAGIPVLGGLFDIDACALGSGVIDSQMISVISGTWNINTYPSQKPVENTNDLMNSLFLNGQYLVEASSPTSAGNLDAILKILMSEEMLNSQLQGQSIYDSLEEFLEETDEHYSPLIFFPFLYGSPLKQVASSCFFGLTRTTSKSQMIRSVYEGIAFAHKQHIDTLLQTRQTLPKTIRLAGGASNSPAWMQIFSDVLGLPIQTVQGTELGALGGAMLAIKTLDNLSLEEVSQRFVKIKSSYQPNMEKHQHYQMKYQVYQELLGAMSPVWKTLEALK